MNPRQRFAQYIRDTLEGNINERELYQASGMDTGTYPHHRETFSTVSRGKTFSYPISLSRRRANKDRNGYC